MDTLVVENVENKTSLKERLVIALDKLLSEYRNSISKDLFNSLNNMLDGLKTKGASLTDCKKYQPVLVFGKKNLSILLKEHVDPHLSALEDVLHKHQYLEIHFTECSQLNFRFSGVEEYCDNLLTASLRLAHDLDLNTKYQLTSDITLIRLFLLSIYSLATTYTFKTCKACFRRIFSKKYCWLHKSGEKEFYMQAKRVGNFQRPELKEFIEKWKVKREVLGEYPNVISKEGGNIIGTNSDNVSAYHSSVAITLDILHLIESFTQPNWCNGGTAIEAFIESNLPLLNKVIGGQTKEVNSFSEYIRRIYTPNFLDNRYETSTSVIWFFFTLLEAESWFDAEIKAGNRPGLRIKNTLNRDKEIFRLRKKGDSYRQIAKEVNVSKSLVEKICKNISKPKI
jgi:hypothetical protein